MIASLASEMRATYKRGLWLSKRPGLLSTGRRILRAAEVWSWCGAYVPKTAHAYLVMLLGTVRAAQDPFAYKKMLDKRLLLSFLGAAGLYWFGTILSGASVAPKNSTENPK